MLGVPLAGDEGEARRDGGLGDAEQEPDGDGAAEVLDSGEAGEDEAPGDDVGGAVFTDGEALEEAVGGIFPGYVAEVEEGSYRGWKLASLFVTGRERGLGWCLALTLAIDSHHP